MCVEGATRPCLRLPMPVSPLPLPPTGPTGAQAVVTAWAWKAASSPQLLLQLLQLLLAQTEVGSGRC